MQFEFSQNDLLCFRCIHFLRDANLYIAWRKRHFWRNIIYEIQSNEDLSLGEKEWKKIGTEFEIQCIIINEWPNDIIHLNNPKMPNSQ